STPVEMHDAHDDARTTAEFWDLELGADDQTVLDQAFERDGELRVETAAMFGRFLELDLRDTFVTALVGRLRGLTASQRPVGAVMPALEDTLAAARGRGRARTAESRGQG
ncbi:MAG: hypothetical protein LC790_21175, partial [Actinobacteria bacterium]|nr:hypothetical protein [Actinomycetota bacterium]